MDIRAWTLLWAVSMAVPALASGPADTAARAPVSSDVGGFIIRTPWEGKYRSTESRGNAKIVRGVLRINGGLPRCLRLPPEAGTSGPCELVGNGETYRAIYRLRGGWLLIAASLQPGGPRPRDFTVTTDTDLLFLWPADSR